MSTHFVKLTQPTLKLVDIFNRWENDPDLIPLTRRNSNQSELGSRQIVTLKNLTQRLKHRYLYLIYDDNHLIGEMNYMIDPKHLYKKEPETAWIGITIGDSKGRGRGIGYEGLQYLEAKIKESGLKRIELGVFEFNIAGQKLYQKLDYKEIGRIKDFTYYQNKMWSDIRMEKYL
ncbi:GNAT family N-acetyltransferase [Oceanobacillus sojae]|uniref:GNAT family N-acetyltransferase n=1 Tax=Oceanobacillus sojae TaxID=582851 RepID=UPI00098834D0|nr:GNAT family protein [Oceanobacillus sojae]